MLQIVALLIAMIHASAVLNIDAHQKRVALDMHKNGIARVRLLPIAPESDYYEVEDVVVDAPLDESQLSIARPSETELDVSLQSKWHLRATVIDDDVKVTFTTPQGVLVEAIVPLNATNPSARMTFPLATHAYGIPERAVDFSLRRQVKYRLYNLDVFQYKIDDAGGIYGTIPFLLTHGVMGSAGALMLNGADASVTLLGEGGPIVVDWTAVVGPVDLYFMPGPTPMAVQHQHAQLTGPVFMPPLFALGYHQCRWNYRSTNDCLDVNQGFETHGIPYDVLWLDIEHTDGKKYFTWDKHNFPNPKALIDEIASYGRKVVTIVDPHVKREAGYYVHDEATSQGYYVKRPDGSDFEGHCWPGTSSWVDYYNKKARDWYASLFSFDRYEHSSPALFTWIDMNEPSVFNAHEVTMDVDAIHTSAEGKRVAHKYLHNMYGFYNAMAVHQGHLERSTTGSRALSEAARPFILTRSFFAGSQRYVAAWTGDNMARWDHLQKSLPMLLALSVANFPFAGADVGGFFFDPEAALVTRWYQAGIFYPFFRGHAHLESKRREPWLFDAETTRRVRDAITLRYSLLPYLYSVFWRAHRDGEVILRPLMMEFPTDETVFAEQNTFCFGPSLAVSPITTEEESTHTVLLPQRVAWYDYHTGARVVGPQTIAVTMDTIPLYLRAGHIIPTRERLRRSTAGMRHDPITLVVAPNDLRQARGSIHLDDGESMRFVTGSFVDVEVVFSDGVLRGRATRPSTYRSLTTVERVIVMGVTHPPSAVVRRVDGVATPLGFDVLEGGRLVVRKPDVELDGEWEVEIMTE